MPDRHVPPTSHFLQAPPPQSGEVSAPFFTVSVHVGVWHLAPVHTPLWQSPASLQPPPEAHAGQPLPPPQSISVSVPFFTVSGHAACWHRLPVQTLLVQSPAPPQALPVPHGPQFGPPQSVSVSPWFLEPSVHVGG